MVDGEPVPRRPHVESTRVPLVTRSDERYLHTLHMCDTSLQSLVTLTLEHQCLDGFTISRLAACIRAAACYFSDFCVNLLIHAFLKFHLRKGNLDGNRHLYNC